MYRVYHSNLAPELIAGVVPQSVFTDVYSIGALSPSYFLYHQICLELCPHNVLIIIKRDQML